MEAERRGGGARHAESTLDGPSGEKRKEKTKKKKYWSSEYELMVDAWELSGEEGRGKLRKAAGRSTHPVIRRLPNGVTRPE